MTGQHKERCFACGKRLGKNPKRVDTLEDQTVLVGRECFKKIGPNGYQPPLGGPKLYPLTDKRMAELKAKGIINA